MKVRFTIDGEGLRHLKNADPLLGEIINRVAPIELELRDDRFAALARAIVGQQLSVSAAQTIWRRLAELVGTIDAEAIASIDPGALRQVGLSQAKALHLTGLARQVHAGELDLTRLDRLADADVLGELMQIKGVGRWTAEMFLIFSLGRTDVFAADDVGLRRAMDALYTGRLSAESRDKIADAWRPFRSLASLCLWKALDQGMC